MCDPFTKSSGGGLDYGSGPEGLRGDAAALAWSLGDSTVALGANSLVAVFRGQSFARRFAIMSDVSHILSQIDEGDPSAAEQLLPLVYDELRKLAAAKLAQEAPGQTLQATALVHEAYLRLAGPTCRAGSELSENGDAKHQGAGSPHWDSRGHFFAAAAEAMRRILIDQARRKRSLKRAGELDRAELPAIEAVSSEGEVDVLVLDEALDQLAARDANAAELVKLRFFAGLTADQAAAVLGVSERTADRIWAYARSFLFKELGPASA